MAPKMIFVPTVQHTGSCFALLFLERFGFKAKEVLPVIEGGQPLIQQPTLLHTHFPIMNTLDCAFEPAVPYYQRLPKTAKSLPIEAIRLLCSLYKTVIPIRDPLAAILTREARHPELRHFYIVNGYKQLAYLAGNLNVRFLPIDLYPETEKRKDLLLSILTHCEIDPEPHLDFIDRMAEQWRPENETPNNRFRELYADKKIDEIRFLLGPKWAEVVYLKNSAGIILPFLTSLGYTKGDLDLW